MDAKGKNSGKKIVIVGGVAGGASCAARLRRLDENAEIIMVERGPYVSYANCGLPYHVGGVIEKEAVCRIHTTFVATKTDYEKKPPDLTMYETSMRTETPTKVVRLTFSENKPYSLKPIYRIATIVSAGPETPDYWIETGSYIVDMRDFDELWEAFLATQKR